MTGSFYVLLSLAEAIASLLPAVGPAATRRSRIIIRRASRVRTALVSTATAPVRDIRAFRRRSDDHSNAVVVGEALSP